MFFAKVKHVPQLYQYQNTRVYIESIDEKWKNIFYLILTKIEPTVMETLHPSLRNEFLTESIHLIKME